MPGLAHEGMGSLILRDEPPRRIKAGRTHERGTPAANRPSQGSDMRHGPKGGRGRT